MCGRVERAALPNSPSFMRQGVSFRPPLPLPFTLARACAGGPRRRFCVDAGGHARAGEALHIAEKAAPRWPRMAYAATPAWGLVVWLGRRQQMYVPRLNLLRHRCEWLDRGKQRAGGPSCCE
eukprot:335102-Chlamydomonas_euryale.AAC.5